MKKKILFVPDAYYLSNSIYSEFCDDKLKDYRYIYFDTNYPMSFIQLLPIEIYTSNKYDSIIEIENPYKSFFYDYFKNKNIIYRLINLLKFCRSFNIYKKIVKNALKDVSPDIIIVTTDKLMISHILNEYSQENEIKFIIIQPAFLETPKRSLSYRSKNLFHLLFFNSILKIPLGNKNSCFGNEFENSYLLLWGEYFRKNYYDKNINKKIRLIGNPEFDKLITRSEKRIIKLKEVFPTDKLEILICTQELKGIISESTYKNLVKEYVEIVEKNSKYNFCIKVHPRENINEYNKLLENKRLTNYRIKQNEELESLFDSNFIQMSVGSLTSFNSILAGLPIIIYKPDLLPYFNHFTDESFITLDNNSSFAETIRLINSKEYYSKFLDIRNDYIKKMLRRNSNLLFNNFIKEIEYT